MNFVAGEIKALIIIIIIIIIKLKAIPIDRTWLYHGGSFKTKKWTWWMGGSGISPTCCIVTHNSEFSRLKYYLQCILC